MRIDNLPPDHPARNVPLAENGARCRFGRKGTWKEILPSFKIAKLCYNELGAPWTEKWEWEIRDAE
jgi:hypothetical protein